MRYEFALGDPCILLTSVRLQYRYLVISICLLVVGDWYLVIGIR